MNTKNLHQFYSYFAAAGVGYAGDLLTLFYLHQVLGAHYLLSAAAGFLVGLAILYVISKRYVFGASKLSSKTAEIGLFALIGVVGLGILTLLMWLLTGIFGVNYLLAKIAATVMVYTWNFFARRTMYHG